MEIGKYDIREGLLYDKHDNWIRLEGDTAVFGLSDFGVKQAKDIAYIELPEKGAKAKIKKACGQIESAKWAGDLIAPVSGEITEVNDSVAEDPSGINIDPYGAWIAKIKMSSPNETKELMDATAYGKWINSQHNK